MNFSLLSFTAVLAGGLAIAGLLYLLQRLKVRRRAVHLPAAMLWRQAARELPPRVLGKRFRDWLAWLLSLLIALLLWLAFAGPRPAATPAAQVQLFYLDASAWMTAGDDFAQAKAALLADLERAPADAYEVYLGDADNTALLRQGESPVLLVKRLQGVTAQAHPSGFDRWLADMGRRAGPDAPVQVRYYGSPAGAAARDRDVPVGLELIWSHLATPLPGNRGLVNLGVAAAASARWDKVDVLLEVAATGMELPKLDELRFELDGQQFAPANVTVSAPGKWLLRDLEARGGELTVALRERDGFAVDDGARLRLPERRPIRVALTPGVPRAIGDVIAVDPALEIGDATQAQVLVRLSSEPDIPGKPALVLGDPATQDSAFTFGYVTEAERRELLDNLAQLGLSQAQNSALADRFERAVGVELAPADRRSVAVWREVFDAQSPFVKSRAMPVFVAQSLRWLAPPPLWSPYAQAGRPLVERSGLYGLTGSAQLEAQGLGDAVYLPAVGEYRVGAQRVSVSLVDRGISMAVATPRPDRLPERVSLIDRVGGSLPTRLALLLAAVLLAVEWRLYQRGRMP
ncbi:hypothetical protein AMP9_4051 [plant metagenome]|uniref:Aerotolerance regulator N-terminal domain-containing protein n=1 Tax=plant metagenome TaxID=1297885 RepID=A0A484PAD5_9ZZZZ